MEPWQVMFTTLYSLPLAWVCVNSIRLGTKVTTIMHNVDHLVSGQERLFTLFTAFTKTEIDELKNIAKSIKQNAEQ